MVSKAMKGIRFYLPCSWRDCITSTGSTCVVQGCVVEMAESALKKGMCSQASRCSFCWTVTAINMSAQGLVKRWSCITASLGACILCSIAESRNTLLQFGCSFLTLRRNMTSFCLFFRQQEPLWLNIVPVWGSHWARKTILLWLLMATHWSMPFRLKSGRASWTWHSPVKQSFVAGKKLWDFFW